MPSSLKLASVSLLSIYFISSPLRAAEGVKSIDLTNAIVVVQNENNHAASQLLIDEVAVRTGLNWKRTTNWPDQKTIVALTSDRTASANNLTSKEHTAHKPESYHVQVQQRENGQTIVWVAGHDDRGLLFGVGALLRKLEWSQGQVLVPTDLNLAVTPAYPIRGHQIGYRARANSWDAWTIQQFEQYVRDLAVFGTNAIENIPFQDPRHNSMMKYERREFNRMLSEVCDKYDLDYWVWTPADFDLNDAQLRADMLRRHKELYTDCPRLDGVFFPAGDPGENPPELVLPFLEEIAGPLREAHPHAKIWMSLQLLSDENEDKVFDYINEKQPDWLGGLVAGPSSMPIPEIRKRLPEQYQFRLYPDITHNKLCQYIVPEWDPALANTLGREAINPRPVEFAHLHNLFAPYSDGFISYSDGVHDDVNKIIYSARSVDPNGDVREILIDYCRYFFDPAVAEEAADGILALERNWHGSLVENGSIEATLRLWQELETKAPQLKENWRWQMNLVRAYYDAYTRRRLIYETKLAEEANSVLRQASETDADSAMIKATLILNRSITEPASP
ncbi:MAG: hypothetical protein KDA65_14265 [Planctomycetaceae bacterium]|nr:hypothetical protein [Planctomycetaceae bacterium]